MKKIDETPDDILFEYGGYIPEWEADRLHDTNVRWFDQEIKKGHKVFLLSTDHKDSVVEYLGQQIYNFCCRYMTTDENVAKEYKLKVNKVKEGSETILELLSWCDEKINNKEMEVVLWV